MKGARMTLNMAGAALLLLTLMAAGCRQDQGPALRVDVDRETGATVSEVRQTPVLPPEDAQTIRTISPDTRIVAGEPVAPPPQNSTPPNNQPTAEDQEGAVAFKKSY